VHTWSSFPSTCFIWLEKPSLGLEEKTTKLKSDAGFVSDFSGPQKQVGMGAIFILSLGQQHNSLICSYINIAP